MTDSEYEILPHKLLSDLKYDVEALKKKLSQPDRKSEELILEIESLKDAIHDLHNVFQKALAEMKEEEDLGSLNEKIKQVVSQNETIAKGMIAISEKLEDFMQDNNTKKFDIENKVVPPPPINQHTMGMPQMNAQSRMAPLPQMDASENMDFPPPPPSPSGKKRLGLF